MSVQCSVRSKSGLKSSSRASCSASRTLVEKFFKEITASIAGLLPGGDQCATNSWILSLIALPCSANVLSYLSFDFVKKLPMSRSCRSRASGNAIV